MCAIVCSTFCRLNSGTHKRTKFNPLGDTKFSCIRRGNTMCSRMVLILVILTSLGNWWVIEQPLGSMLLEHPRMQQLLGMHSVFKMVTHMWKFGKNSSKPTILFSNKPWIMEIERYRTVVHKPRAVQKLVKLKRTRTRVKWTGDKKALKSSQEYTKDFWQGHHDAFCRPCRRDALGSTRPTRSIATSSGRSGMA